MNVSSGSLALARSVTALLAAALAAAQSNPPTPEAGRPSWRQPSTELNGLLPGWLHFHGEERARFENVSGLRFGEGSDAYLLNRLRVEAVLAPAPWLKLDAQLQDSRAFWRQERPNGPPYQDRADLRLGLAEIGDPERWHAGFRVGRQELQFGDERLIGISNWTNVARSFDGYRATLKFGRLRLDGFAASVVVLHDGQIGQHLPGNYIHGLYGQVQNLVFSSTLQPYLLWRRSPDEALENGSRGNLHFATVGYRWTGALPRGIDFNSEMALQRGSLRSERVSAWASHLRVRYKVPLKFAGSLHYGIEYNFASGDHRRGDGVRGTFDTLYASGHDKIELADQVGWKNIQHVRTGPEVDLGGKVSLSFRYSRLWLADAHDALYNSSGAAIARRSDGSAGRSVGHELDVTVTYSPVKKQQLGVGFGKLIPGRFLRVTTPGHSYNYPYIYYDLAL